MPKTIKTKRIILEIMLSINKDLFLDNQIPYKLFKYTEESILNQIKER